MSKLGHQIGQVGKSSVVNCAKQPLCTQDLHGIRRRENQVVLRPSAVQFCDQVFVGRIIVVDYFCSIVRPEGFDGFGADVVAPVENAQRVGLGRATATAKEQRNQKDGPNYFHDRFVAFQTFSEVQNNSKIIAASPT